MTVDADSTGDIIVTQRSPTDVFALLGDESRVAIIEELGRTPQEPVPFAELHRRVGIRDSGQFNYHLGKLRDAFVRKDEDGYRLTYAGQQIVGAMHAGTYTANATIAEIPVDNPCQLCHGEVVATYADERATIACTDCDEWTVELGFPPGSLDQYDREELPSTFDRWTKIHLRGSASGFCHTCAGRITGKLVVDDEEIIDDSTPAFVEYRCERCLHGILVSAPVPVMFHPVAQGFLYDHGTNPEETPTWQLLDVVAPDIVVESNDPVRATIRFERDGEVLVAVMEADTRITSIERRPSGSSVLAGERRSKRR